MWALIEAGLVERPVVALAALRDDAPVAAVETWNLVRDVLTVRVAMGEQQTDPLPLSSPWLASLNGTDEKTIRAGKRWLEQRGYIEHVGVGPSRFGHPLTLWSVKTRFASGQPKASEGNE
ncbi:MAG: hypothetical protein ABI783_03765 [Actinomycetota bacterium]